MSVGSVTALYHRIAVVIPCHNEALAVPAVVRDFQAALPGAEIIVFDNNSTDDTAEAATKAGARVVSVALKGKGNVVRRMFADVDADVYVMVDGDATYDAFAAPKMIRALCDRGLDMVVGARVSDEIEAYRAGHRFGNWILTKCVATIFGRTYKDMLSGYRVFSRRFVKSFPAHSKGFETETELTVHALGMRMPSAEFQTKYISRMEGSESKLNTYRDGMRILVTILRLCKSERPLATFTVGFAVCALLSIVLAFPLFETYFQTGLVPRLPTAVLSVAMMLAGAMSLLCGILLDAITHARSEAKRFIYLSESAPTPLPEMSDDRFERPVGSS